MSSFLLCFTCIACVCSQPFIKTATLTAQNSTTSDPFASISMLSSEVTIDDQRWNINANSNNGFLFKLDLSLFWIKGVTSFTIDIIGNNTEHNNLLDHLIVSFMTTKEDVLRTKPDEYEFLSIGIRMGLQGNNQIYPSCRNNENFAMGNIETIMNTPSIDGKTRWDKATDNDGWYNMEPSISPSAHIDNQWNLKFLLINYNDPDILESNDNLTIIYSSSQYSSFEQKCFYKPLDIQGLNKSVLKQLNMYITTDDFNSSFYINAIKLNSIYANSTNHPTLIPTVSPTMNPSIYPTESSIDASTTGLLTILQSTNKTNITTNISVSGTEYFEKTTKSLGSMDDAEDGGFMLLTVIIGAGLMLLGVIIFCLCKVSKSRITAEEHPSRLDFASETEKPQIGAHDHGNNKRQSLVELQEEVCHKQTGIVYRNDSVYDGPLTFAAEFDGQNVMTSGNLVDKYVKEKEVDNIDVAEKVRQTQLEDCNVILNERDNMEILNSNEEGNDVNTTL